LKDISLDLKEKHFVHNLVAGV